MRSAGFATIKSSSTSQYTRAFVVLLQLRTMCLVLMFPSSTSAMPSPWKKGRDQLLFLKWEYGASASTVPPPHPPRASTCPLQLLLAVSSSGTSAHQGQLWEDLLPRLPIFCGWPNHQLAGVQKHSSFLQRKGYHVPPRS